MNKGRSWEWAPNVGGVTTAIFSGSCFLKAPVVTVQRSGGSWWSDSGAGPTGAAECRKQCWGAGPWVDREGRVHGLSEGREWGRPAAFPASRARVGLCEAQEGMGSAAGMYRS
jgi:hypothetical protein